VLRVELAPIGNSVGEVAVNERPTATSEFRFDSSALLANLSTASTVRPAIHVVDGYPGSRRP
jgi:hypothetical protein